MLEKKKKRGLKFSEIALFLLFEQGHISLASSEGILWENQVSEAQKSIKLFLFCRPYCFFCNTHTYKCPSSQINHFLAFHYETNSFKEIAYSANQTDIQIASLGIP